MVGMHKVLIVVLWVVKFNPEDESNMFLKNVGYLLQYHMASQPRRPQSTSSLL
jgi:hypothetical protein